MFWVASREEVQVELRASTSMSPDLSGSNRSLALSGTYRTLLASLKIAAAIARQISTSKPVQVPLSSGAEKPGRPWLTPQTSMPRSFTVLSTWAKPAEADRPSSRTAASSVRPNVWVTGFMAPPLERMDVSPSCAPPLPDLPSGRRLVCGRGAISERPRTLVKGLTRATKAFVYNFMTDKDGPSRPSTKNATRLVAGGRDPF